MRVGVNNNIKEVAFYNSRDDHNFSGAGKSTFMNSLMQRNIRGLITTGDVYVNGQAIGRDITGMQSYLILCLVYFC